MIETFFSQLAIPESCQLDKRIFKKMFYDNGQLNAADKKAFSDDIDEIIWRYTLKPETINIPRYDDADHEYHEIAIIQIALKDTKRLKRIAQIIQRSIPYPLLLVFTQKNSLLFNAADKRINKVDISKLVIDESIYSDWLDLDGLQDYEQDFISQFTMKQFSYQDLYRTYLDMIDKILNLNCGKITGTYSQGEPKADIDRRACLANIHKYQQQQSELRSALKKESQFNRKIDLNIQIKQLEQQIISVQNQL
tara:strand:+ start:16785 stop:17537 length:753 start_codon:yes stop_codon:yes gene_type:complete